MKTVLIIFFIFVSLAQCISIKHDDLCFPKQGKEFGCYDAYSFSCGGFVCTKSQNTCHVLSSFNGLKGKESKYRKFIQTIKKCAEPPKYKWNKNDVCLNSKTCIKPEIHRLWSTQIKLIECKCIGKHSFRCDSHYCGIDERACNGLKKTKIAGINKCK